MLRNRDIVAILLAVVLARLTWQGPAGSGENVSLWASIHLSFYIPLKNVHSLYEIEKIEHEGGSFQVMDLDGDGRPEGLAMIAFRHDTSKTDGDGEAKKLSTKEKRKLLTSNHFNRHGSYEIQIVDLKPGLLQASSRTITAPFRPTLLLRSDPIPLKRHIEADDDEADTAYVEPLAMTTGQVVLAKNSNKKAFKSRGTETIKIGEKEVTVDDRTRKFFCGKDWHDAAENCRTPCPNGQTKECEDGDKCYADTNCDYWEWKDAQKDNGGSMLVDSDKYHTTAAGAWPSVWTFWSNGAVTMHSVTSEKADANPTSDFEKLMLTKAKNFNRAQLVQMWQVEPFLKKNNRSMTDTMDPRIRYVDAVSTGMDHGMVIISGDMDWIGSREDEEDEWASKFVIALSDQTGELLWQSYDEVEDLAESVARPMDVSSPYVKTRGRTSFNRRRSQNPNLHHKTDSVRDGQITSFVPNCLHTYRHSLLKSEAFPSFYGDEVDADLRVIHLDHPTHKGASLKDNKKDRNRKIASGSNGGGDAAGTARASASLSKNSATAETEKSSTDKKTKAKDSKWGLWTPVSALWPKSSKSQDHKKVHRRNKRNKSGLNAKPNAIATNHYDGMQVRSLKNGRSLCHLSLWDNTVYVDLNGDGVLDSVQVFSGHQNVEQYRGDAVRHKFVQKLVERASGQSKNASIAEERDSRVESSSEPMCHIIAMSGVPSKEELFSGSVCGNRRDRKNAVDPSKVFEAAAPLIVEPDRRGRRRKRSGWDVIIAMSSGLVHRFRGSTGRRIWQFAGQHHKDFPTWDFVEEVQLNRIEASGLPNSIMDPIVLAGRNSAALLSPDTGKLLALTKFPQSAEGHAILGDWNGDGTDDIIVSTNDAVWGYSVRVQARPSIFHGILMGILLVAILLAMLRNRFGPAPGKRSTDA